MKLFHSPASPFVRKVVVLIEETGQSSDVDLVTIATTATSTDADLAAQNPLGKIPALVLDNGDVLFDSRVICRFLDARVDAGLYPKGAGEMADLTLEATADGIMDAGISMVYEYRIRPEDKQWDGWLDAQWAKIDRTLRSLEAQATSTLSGDLTAGKIALACALGYLDFRHDARNWRAIAPNLGAWFDDFATRPSMVESRPD